MNKLKLEKIKLLDLSMNEQNRIVGGMGDGDTGVGADTGNDGNDPEKITWTLVLTILAVTVAVGGDNTSAGCPSNTCLSQDPAKWSCGLCSGYANC